MVNYKKIRVSPELHEALKITSKRYNISQVDVGRIMARMIKEGKLEVTQVNRRTRKFKFKDNGFGI